MSHLHVVVPGNIWLRAHNHSIPNRKFLIRNFHGFLKGILPFLGKFLEISMVFSERVFYPKKILGNFLTEISMGITSPFGLRSRSLWDLLSLFQGLPKRKFSFLSVIIELCELNLSSPAPHHFLMGSCVPKPLLLTYWGTFVF